MHSIDPVVVLEGVTKSFPQSYRFSVWLKHRGAVPQRRVLRDVGFSVQRGEVFGLLGANGAGKTTLLKLIAKLALPTRGSISIAGDLGFAPAEDRSFYFRLTARENLKFFGLMAGLPPSRVAERIEHVMAVVGLSADLDRRFYTLSSGMRQRLTIARALLHDPALLLLDEPTHTVDPLQAASLRRFIRDELATSGKTIIVSTNVIEEAWALCDRVAILHDGRVVALESPERLRDLASSFRRYRVCFDREDREVVTRLQTVPGVRAVDLDQTDQRALTVEFSTGHERLNEMLFAISCNGVTVERVEPIELQPSEVFSALVRNAQ